MKKFTKAMLFFIILSPIILGIVSSCTQESDCSIAGRSMMRSLFYAYNEEGTLVAVQLDSLTVTALGTDSVLLNRGADITELSIPLQYTVDSTAIIFRYQGNVRDTIIFRHTNTPYFLSMECGYEVQQTVNKIQCTQHVLDTIIIRDKQTNTDGTENLQLILFTN